ncbi:MAG: PD-(D/E)XK motif protein [Mariniphaga sp.]
MSNIKKTWELQASSGRNGVIRERVDNIPALNCYVGTISVSQAKLFLMELDNSIQVHANYLKRFVGVEIQILPLEFNKKELVIILLENELSEIFIYFIEDIIVALKDISNQEDALLAITQKVNYWKKLFSKFTGDLLTPQQQRGLYGELYFLNLLLENFNADRMVISGWQAPNGANQDFYYSGTAIEVKTSKSNNPSIKISNEFQLDVTGLSNLYLAFYKLNEYPGTQNSLAEIISNIRNRISTDKELVNVFNDKLESLGITTETESEYNNQSFIIRDEKYYLITPEFPKITRETIDKAIFGVSYEIVPIECVDYEQTLNTIISEITNGNI